MLSWLRRRKEAVVQQEKAKLSALVRGIMDSVQSASELAGQQHFEALRNYFVVQPDGTLLPRYVRIGLPDGSVMDVPVFTLVNPSSYKLKSLDVRMAVHLEPHEIKSAVSHGVGAEAGSRCSYAVRMGHEGAKGAVKLRLSFAAEDEAPEALSRIIEELGRGIGPVKEPPQRPLWAPGSTNGADPEDEVETVRIVAPGGTAQHPYEPHDHALPPGVSGSEPPHDGGSGI